MELADHLAAGRIGKVTLESTSDGGAERASATAGDGPGSPVSSSRGGGFWGSPRHAGSRQQSSSRCGLSSMPLFPCPSQTRT